MPIITSNAWKYYFIGLPAIDDTNANIAVYTTALAIDTTDDEELSDPQQHQ